MKPPPSNSIQGKNKRRPARVEPKRSPSRMSATKTSARQSDCWPRWPGPPQIERDTPIVPYAVATGVLAEAIVWLREELPRDWVVLLMERAEAIYASNARVRRQLRAPGNKGRDWLWTFTRHWVAALIREHRPTLYPRLPASYSVGHLLPQEH